MANSVPRTWYTPSDAPRNRLTFGVELEIALPSLLDGEPDPNPEDSRSCYNIRTGPLSPEENARQHVANTLIDADIPAEVKGPIHRWKPQSVRSWVICEDVDIWPPDNTPSIYQWHPVELNSPPFYSSAEAFAEVMFVVSLLTNRYRCALTQRTALHIHVGNATMGLDAETTQKLLGTYWAFEPLIEEIHPDFRINNPATLSLRRGIVMMCQGPETFGGLGAVILPQDKRTPEGGLEWLLAKEHCDLKQLRKATESYREYPKYGPYGPDNHISYGDPVGETRSAVNIRNLADSVAGTKKTVEFRQHTMTLDCERVDHWLRFCVELVEFAGNADLKILRPFLDTCVRGDGRLGLKEVLKEIGMEREGIYFGAVVENNRKAKTEQ